MGWMATVAKGGALLGVIAASFVGTTWYLDRAPQKQPAKPATALNAMARATDLLRCQRENPIAPGGKPAQLCVDIARSLLQITRAAPVAGFRGHGIGKFEVFVTEKNAIAVRKACSAADVAVPRFEWVLNPIDVSRLPEDRKKYGNLAGYVDFDVFGYSLDGACVFALEVPTTMAFNYLTVSQFDAKPGVYSWRLEIKI